MSGVNRRFFDSMMVEKKLSLRGLAAKMGMNHSQLSLTFSGGRRMTLDEASQLSNIFGVPLHVVVEAAGVSVRHHNVKRVKVIGAVNGDGTVTLHSSGTMERTTAPADLPDDTSAVQFRTAGTDLGWMDGAVSFFRKPEGTERGSMGRLCLCQIKGGPSVLAMVNRGYKDNTVNLSGPYRKDSVSLEWCTPVEFTRN